MELGRQVKLHLVLEGVLLQHMPEHASLHQLVANGDSFCIRVCNACFSKPSHRLCPCKTVVVLALCAAMARAWLCVTQQQWSQSPTALCYQMV